MMRKNALFLFILSGLIGVLYSGGPPHPQVPFSSEFGQYVANPPYESAISRASKEKKYRKFQRELVEQALEAARQKNKKD